jgi:hypothetical protein
MLSWVIQITVISTILIFLVHHLINFFKSTLTVPKIKDLVNTPSIKYENMYNIIKNKDNGNTGIINNNIINNNNSIVNDNDKSFLGNKSIKVYSLFKSKLLLLF